MAPKRQSRNLQPETQLIFMQLPFKPNKVKLPKPTMSHTKKGKLRSLSGYCQQVNREKPISREEIEAQREYEATDGRIDNTGGIKYW